MHAFTRGEVEVGGCLSLAFDQLFFLSTFLASCSGFAFHDRYGFIVL